MSAAKLSPTARLLRNSRLFALPQAITTPDFSSTKSVNESDTATLPHPVRASIVTPASSLSRGDWGLKRPLPAKSTSHKSSRPIVRINELDTFEHVTDFESAADHTMTLEKFQELNMPLSFPTDLNFVNKVTPRHQSPFETQYDNTGTTQTADAVKQPEAKQFRHTGPWLAGQTGSEFDAYLKRVTKDKPAIVAKIRANFIRDRQAELKRKAQDKGEDIEEAPEIPEKEFQHYLKTLRADPFALGPVIFDMLDLPSQPTIPGERLPFKKTWYASPPTKMPVTAYAHSGPPKTHPSAGLSYARTNASVYNHPKYGPQTYQRPVQARILRPRGRVKGKSGRAVAGIGGIVSEDMNTMAFQDYNAPAGLSSFDASIPGGGKYYVSPIRAAVSTDGRINLSTFRASNETKAAHGLQDFRKPTVTGRTSLFERMRASQRTVPRLDRARTSQQPYGMEQPKQETEGAAKDLLKKNFPSP